MTGKGNGRMTKVCKELSDSGYPHEVSRLGLINLLAGTEDRENPKHWEWTGMVWGWSTEGKRYPDDLKLWSNEYRQNKANKEGNDTRYIDLLLLPKVTPAVAAQWLKDIGETPDTLSEEVKHWLCDYLDKPGKPRQHRKHRQDLLRQVVEQLKTVDPNLDTSAMPGTRADLQALCRKLHQSAFSISESVFKNDLSGICAFRSGARSSSYYRMQLSRLS
ncbi:hypothetical protein NVV93_07270 [Pseudomonas sp. LS44]|uniref:hypothetical protein n=1 Tax=Pseudomonas sp. LS44 TaxID=1357074 RepID=UPI00215A2EC9|nr:hypothetical protein [Pseudomonas sp. LS44]UVE19167.1 hypothetical protein NVV93_07270 [Pseudomonas sp. LS44]